MNTIGAWAARQKVSRSTVIRAMLKDLLYKTRRSPDDLIKANRKAQKPENILKGDFSAKDPNKKWLTDIILISVQIWKAVYCADDGLLCRRDSRGRDGR